MSLESEPSLQNNEIINSKQEIDFSPSEPQFTDEQNISLTAETLQIPATTNQNVLNNKNECLSSSTQILLNSDPSQEESVENNQKYEEPKEKKEKFHWISGEQKLDFSSYPQESIEHMKKTYQPPALENILEKVELDDEGITIKPLPQGNVPRTNLLTLDMSFLKNDHIPVKIQDGLIHFASKSTSQSNQNEQVNLSDQEETQDKQLEEEMKLNDSQSEDCIPLKSRLINKKWCKNVIILFEERSFSGELLDIHRVTKEQRCIKLQGNIAPKWQFCLECLKEGDIGWFEISEQFLNYFEYQQPFYLKIEVKEARPLAEINKLGSIKSAKKDSNDEEVEEEAENSEQQALLQWKKVKDSCDKLNDNGKQEFLLANNQEASKLFLKSFSICRGVTRKTKKLLSKEIMIEYKQKLEQYGGNYVQALMNQDNPPLKEIAEFIVRSKLNSDKNIYRLAKVYYQLKEFDKSIAIIDSLPLPLNNQSQLLKFQCSQQLQKLEKESQENFYQHIFKKNKKEEMKEGAKIK